MPEVAGYVRVSTPEQKLDRQLNSIRDYAGRVLDAELSDLKIYRDSSTGTHTRREGYQDMMGAIESDGFEAVVVHSISRLSRSIRDLERTAERMVEENGCELHIISEGMKLTERTDDPMQNAMFRLLGVFAEFEAELTQMRIKEGIAARQEEEDYHQGPPPLGFVKDDGALIEAENYDSVCATLEMVQKRQLSKRQAAKELGCGRKTIRRAIQDRPKLYGL